MNLEQLAGLLEKWYGVAPNGLGLDAAATAHIANPTLREFYERLGALAESGTRFAHPTSRHRPLATQDRILPVNELRRQGDATIFVLENQDVFVIAASDKPEQQNALVAGDFSNFRLRELTDIGVPLDELLVTLALSETIFSVSDRYAIISPATLSRARTEAASGTHYRGRYVWPELYTDFWLAENLWFMDGDWIKLAAHRDLWRQPQESRRVIINDDGSTSRREPRDRNVTGSAICTRREAEQ
jgi:hypothetical protein